MTKQDDLTFNEVCKQLNRSRRTVSRYIKSGWLNPEKIESKRGTLKYKFKRNDLLKFKKPGKTKKTEKARQARG